MSIILNPPVLAAQPATLSTGWIFTSVTFQGESHDVNVYLPADYPLAAPYPVVYLLPGWDDDPDAWAIAEPALAAQAELHDFLIVVVEGDAPDIFPAWYSRQSGLPWPGGPDWTVSFYDWFFEGVLPWVAASYPIRDEAGGRAIVGFSMGGKGAMSLASHRPDLFSAVAEWSGVMDLRDYARSFQIEQVYGSLAAYPLRYAADSPLELAPNLKGLNITLMHGAADTFVSYQQSRAMHQTLDNLGYAHLWQEVPGLAHDISDDELTQTLERIAATFAAPYTRPDQWRYRLADDLGHQVYGLTLTKTNALTWTELLSVTHTGFTTASGDAFTLKTAPLYAPRATYAVTTTRLTDNQSTPATLTTDATGRLLLSLPAGQHRVAIAPQSLPPVTPTPAGLSFTYLPVILVLE